MKIVLITGGSGMVGGLILKACLASDQVDKVISIVRKSTGKVHSKLQEVIHNDFLDYSSIEGLFKNIEVAYFCIGVYSGAVPDELFKIITVDYCNRFADILKNSSPNATFCLLSGQGADQKEKSRISFAKYKGMAENYLIKKSFNELYIFRPGYIYPVKKRVEPNISYRVFRSLYPIMKKVYAHGVITSETLANAMFKAGLEGGQQSILENEDIKKIVNQ